MKSEVNKIMSKYLSGTASTSEKQQLLDWLEESEKNKKLFNQMKDIHLVSGIKHATYTHKKHQSWNKVDRKINRNNAVRFGNVIKYAAILVLAMLIGAAITKLAENFIEANIEVARVEVPNGQMSKIILFDGTEVWLNSGSVIEYPNKFNEEERTVFIQGEAFFDVAKNEKIPFIVESKNMHVKVLGTSFNISAYENDQFTNLTLVEGKVDLLTPSGKFLTELVPGEMADLKSGKLSIKKVDTSFYSSWKEGKIEFKSIPLEEITKKLERWYNVSIDFHDDESKALKFSGTVLKNKPIEQIIKAIQLLSPINYKITLNPEGKDQIEIFAEH